jgi:hypothetical protein
MRPRILAHVFDNESKSETLGFLIFFAGTVQVVRNPVSEAAASHFFWCVVFSSILVGGKMVTKAVLEAAEMKLNGGKPKEVTPHAPATPQP